MPELVPVCELCEALAKPDDGANADADAKPGAATTAADAKPGVAVAAKKI